MEPDTIADRVLALLGGAIKVVLALAGTVVFWGAVLGLLALVLRAL